MFFINGLMYMKVLTQGLTQSVLGRSVWGGAFLADLPFPLPPLHPPDASGDVESISELGVPWRPVPVQLPWSKGGEPKAQSGTCPRPRTGSAGTCTPWL